MTLVDGAKTLLNRGWVRPVLGPVVTRLARQKGNGVQRIFCDHGIWMHRTSSGYFAYREPYVRLNLEQLDAFARSVFFWGYRPRAGDVIVDVGAGVGEEALTFSRAVGERGRVICIEAHPETFRCLQKLVQYNRLGNVTMIRRAVSEPSCELAMIEDGKHYLRNRLGGDKGIAVRATTLDALHQELELGRIQFLKMNIEGAERFAIRGMREALRQTETLCVCCHDFLAEAGGEEGLRTKGAVREFLERSGFRVIQRQESNLAPYVRDQLWGYNQQLTETAAG
jgi:FkbM family methyltransferase